ncbi:MAG: S8 family serine peptidase, partial [Actinomycetota bacterium]|nr:S8 family serine peptidase [Actinomycetota bacterium]
MSFASNRNNSGKSRLFGALGVGVLAVSLLVTAPPSSRAAETTGKMVGVIVRSMPSLSGTAQNAVTTAGGRVQRQIGIIHGFSAEVPSTAIAGLRTQPGIYSVDLDVPVHFNGLVDGFDAKADPGSMFNTAKSIKASDSWKAGYTGQGIGVALIDSGVVPVDGLTSTTNDGSPKVTQGPDLSLDNSTAGMSYLDGYGHGTHMAGIIAGKDDGLSTVPQYTNTSNFVGIAPDAHLINVKVGSSNGTVDVSQVLA